MAKHIFRDAFLSLNGADLSDHVVSVEPSWNVGSEVVTAMSDLGVRKLAGLEDNSFSVVFLQDYAASEVDATLAPLIRAAAFAFEFRPTSAVVSATNPKFTGNAILTSYPPMSGEVGSAHKISVDFEVDGVITRATA